MLFSNNVNDMYGIATCKHITEILLRNDREWFLKISTISWKDIDEFVSTTYSDAEVNGFSAIVLFMRDKLKMPAPQLDNFKRVFSSYIIDFQERFLPREYMVVPDAERAIRVTIQQSLRSRMRGARYTMSDSDWTQIFLDFRQFVTRNSSNLTYDPNSEGIIGYLVTSASFYVKNFPADIWKFLTSLGLNQEVEGADYGAIDYQEEDPFLHKDYENFNALAEDIYKVTDFMYRHGGEVYYDLFSRYKFKKVLEYEALIKKAISRAFKFSELRTPTRVIDVNFTVSKGRSPDADKYAMRKKEQRDRLLSYLDPLLEGRAGLSDLTSIIDRMLAANRAIPGKDKQPVFDTPSYSSKDKLTTDEKLERLFVGMVALRKFLDYLKSNQINVFSVSSAIFKDERLILRFDKFSRYMNSNFLDKTQELLSEEKYNGDFISNDQLYRELMKNNSSAVNSIPLKNIKDIIDNMMESSVAEKEPEVVNHFDHSVLGKAAQLYMLFFRSTNLSYLPGRYLAEEPVSKKLHHFLTSKGLMAQRSTGHWEIVRDLGFDKILDSIHLGDAEKVKLSLFFSTLSGGTGHEVYLSYFRSIGFITVFLKYIRELLSLTFRDGQDNQVVATSKFKVFLVINDNKILFTPPKNPTMYSQFSDILDRYGFDYYYSVEEDDSIVSDHLVGLYNTMYDIFSEVLDYARSLYYSVFVSYSEGLPLNYVEDHGLRESLKRAALQLYFLSDLDPNEFPEFTRFKNLSRIDDETGFIMKDGSFYKQFSELEGKFRYLHEKGYWVTLNSDGSAGTGRVTRKETF